MSNTGLSALEKEMAEFDFEALNKKVSAMHVNLAAAKSAADVKNEICAIWSKIRKFVIAGEVIPFIGKYLKILAQLLDSICPTS